MIGRINRINAHRVAWATLGVAWCVATSSPARATDVYWTGASSNAYNTGGNWDSTFVPDGPGFAERAVIGSDKVSAALSGSAVLSANPAAQPGGIALGLRQRDGSGNFVNAAPAPGALTGSLTISGGVVNSVTTGQALFGADGRVLVGVDGRGYLTMTGGTLNAVSLVVAGEENADGEGRSRLDLSGNATLSVSAASPNGGATLGRDLRVSGPNVNFTTLNRLTLASSNAYTANITSATAHSPLKTSNIAVVGGSLAVEFGGAGASHALGQTWTLVDAQLGITGNFNNLGPGGQVEVTGLAAP
ncbi:MAG: hypothetical protein KDA61_14330, partial [Planctomycetales bacterium]|nr:hypothetical protein [Planctomycetales bacterium]